MKLIPVFITTLLGTLAGVTRSAETPVAVPEYKIISKTVLGGDGGWDYLNLDAAARKLYVARSNRFMIIDVDTGKLAGELQSVTGAHGIALLPDKKMGYATSGKDDTVRVFDLQTLKETKSIPVGKKPDAILLDPASKKIFVFNNGATTASVIDPANDTVIGTIELGGNPEFPVADGAGRIFVNIEDKSEVAVIDTAKLSMTQHWLLAPGVEPTGLALDSAHHRLFSGCRGSKTLVIMDSESGKVITSLPIGSGVDATAFDVATQNVFSSNGEGTLSIIHEDTPDSFRVVQTLPTQAGARTCTLDPKTHQVLLVAAVQDRETRAVTPDTFTLIKVGQ